MSLPRANERPGVHLECAAMFAGTIAASFVIALALAWALAVALALALIGMAQAQDAPPNDAPRARVAVLLLATGDLDPSVADELNELLIGGVAARGGVTILGREELEAQIGQSSESLIDCIGSMPCMGRLGVQLGVSEVIAGTLARRDGRWIFNLNRIDVRSGEVVGRAFREVEGELGAVADALSAALPLLYEVRTPAGTIVVECAIAGAAVTLDGQAIGTTATGTLRREGVAVGQHEVRVAAADHQPWARTIDVGDGAEVHVEATLAPIVRDEGINPLVWIGGAVAVGAFAIALPLGISSQSQLDLSLDSRRTMEIARADAVAYYQDREAEAITADVFFAIAGVGLVVFSAALFLPVFHAIDPGPRVAIGPGRVVLEGRFQ